MRIVFLGSPPFAIPVLRHLRASSHTVALLVTPPDRPRGRGRAVATSPLVAMAREHDIPILQPASTRTAEFTRELAAFEPEALLVASYGEILREDVLRVASRGAYNVHASLLPRWRGASPIQNAILAGDAVTGITIQRMVLALDAGDVLLTRETPIGRDETAGELTARLAELGGECAVLALDALASGAAVFTPQDEAGVTLAKKLTKADGVVDWSQPAVDIARFLRAVTPWPGARTTLPGGRELVLLRARVLAGSVTTPGSTPDGEAEAAPGSVLEAQQRFIVATGAGALELLEVKPAGKAAMAGDAFLRGAHLAPGDVLGT